MERNEMWYDRYGRVSKSEATVLGISTAESLSSETFYRGFTPIVERTNSKMNYGATQVIINTRNTYDHSGRLKKLNYALNLQPEITMAEYDYNELGQLSSKKLHKEATSTTFIQAITHQYNIRGWLTHINNNTRTSNLIGTEQPLFGMELYYNTLPSVFGNPLGGSQPPNGSKAQFNGNISATSWSSIRDKEITNANIIRGFTYSYDKMNRLVAANFQSVKPEEIGRYSTAHSYDVNGNILTTQRQGVTNLSNGVFSYGQMDNMQYTYAGNRLMKVNDAVTTQTTLPDFNDNGSTDIDYGYDNNGNLTKDLNKKIESIAYNHLNLPTKIIFTGKGNITYTYNAAGAKLTKTVTEIGKPVKTVAYKYGFLFENEVLKEFATPEGRIVAKTGAFQFQYHYKDHLGNVRMTFAGEEPLLGTMKLSFETDSLAKEKANFTNIVATREQTEGHKNSSFVGKLSRNKGMISSKILKLKQGEKLAVEVAAKYDLEDLPIPYEIAKSKKIKGLDFVPLLSVGEIAVSNTENKAKIINFNFLGLLPLAKKLLKSTSKIPPLGVRGLPQAYLEITTYKDSLLNEVLTEKRLIIGAEAEENWLQVADSVVFSEAVFVVVKLINRADIPVLFDNLELRTYGTQKARIIQENHYEPFGMTLQGLDYVAENTRKNNYLYNGFKVERQEELGLFWDDSHARNYDMQGGRFVSVDPLSEEGQESWSSYHYSYDNPVRYNDPDGNFPILPILAGAAVGAIIGAGVEAVSQYVEHGEVNDWGAVGGAALQGGATGAVAVLTGGQSLAINMVAAGTTNALVGAASNTLQEKEVTFGSVAKDAGLGALGAAGGRVIDRTVGALQLDKAVSKAVVDNAGKSSTIAMRAPYGNVVIATAGEIPKKIAPQLKKVAEKLGGLGTKGVTQNNTVGVCAEFRGANKILLKNPLVNRTQIQRSDVLRLNKQGLKKVPTCNNCKKTFE